MDNLYDHLENYEDENIVDELKKENSQLKFKLEEYSAAMEKLQKDFSKLSSEFKKLEKNYSSLLKTAKQEIERKTQIITKLNTEKDMMVLNAIQNKNLSDLRRRTTFTSKRNDSKNTIEKAKTKIDEVVTTKESAVVSERNELSRLPSEETVTTNSTDTVTKSSSKNFDKWSKKTKDSKENISNSQNTLKNDVVVPKPKALSIKNRRKSMPAIRCEAKFSSDEECDNGNVSLVKYSNKYEAVSHEPKLETFNKFHNEVLKSRFLDERHRMSETSSMDDRCSSYHDNKDHRNKSKYSESDKFRTRDKIDVNRFKRHHSPERFRRHTKKYPDEHYLREEYNRYRHLESPPPEKYHNYQRRNREHRPRYDREEYYNYDRSKDRYEDKYPAKQKLLCPEEPSSKRRRNNSNTYYQEENRWDTDRLSIQNSIPILTDNIDHTSCQSPDYIVPDASTSHPVKEIMNTAATQLEDPRLQSKRYTLQQLNDDAVLSTVIGRNVDLKVIDTSSWNIEQVDIPKALKRRPSQCSDDLVKDIENPVTNMSMESGEISSYATDEEISNRGSREPHNHGKISKICTGIENTHATDDCDNFTHGINKSRYKIPKLKKCHATESTNCNAEQYGNKSSTFASSNKNEIYISKDNTYIPKNSIDISKGNIDTRDDNIATLNTPAEVFQPKIYDSSTQNPSTVIDKPELTKQELTISFGDTNKEIVEGDLELSDETSDYVDLQKKTFIENINTKTRDLAILTHISENPTALKLKNDDFNLENNSTQHDIDKHSEKKVQGNIKKQKTKKRSQKISNKDMLKNEKSELNTMKRTRARKDKIESTEIKTKFSELFGDSSSLITPEDLGINATQTNNQPLAKYIPVCEDAQDAVDLKVTDPNDGQNTGLPLDKLQNIIINDNVINNTCNIEDKIKTVKVTIDNKKKTTNKKEVEDITTTNNVHIKLQPPNDSQPKFEMDIAKNENILSALQNKVVTDIIDFNNIPQTAIQNLIQRPNASIKALATSTPHKNIKESSEIEISSRLPEPNSDNNNVNHDKITIVDNNHTAAEQSSNNDTMDSLTDIDAPDVKISSLRRRRLGKITKR